MRSKTKFLMNKRKFLNKQGWSGLGGISASIERSSWYLKQENCEMEERIEYYAEMSIGDGNRIINLEFDVSNKKKQENTFSKLNILIDTLTEMKEKLLIITEEINSKEK